MENNELELKHQEILDRIVKIAETEKLSSHQLSYIIALSKFIVFEQPAYLTTANLEEARKLFIESLHKKDDNRVTYEFSTMDELLMDNEQSYATAEKLLFESGYTRQLDNLYQEFKKLNPDQVKDESVEQADSTKPLSLLDKLRNYFTEEE